MSLKKAAFAIITLLFVSTGFSQNNVNGTLVTAPIRPFAVQDTFPTAWANEVRGGPFTYNTLTELSNIPSSRLVVGSIGYASSDNKYYKLTSTSPVTWVDFETPVTRATLGFNSILDNLWTADNLPSARSAIGLSTNLETLWTATNAADARAALQITNTGGTGTNGGTVTSVGLALPGIFSVSGSPITSSGTFNVSLQNQNQRLFLASPANANGTPSFRGITAADIPTLNQNTTGTASNVTGVVAIANGGTGATNTESARNNLGFTSVLNNFWTATSISNARAALDAAKLSMNVVGPFESVNNFLNPANTVIDNETLIRVGVAEQPNQSAQFGYRVVGTDSNGVVGRAVFSVYGFDALMQVGSGAQSGTNFETEVFAGGGTGNKVMTLIKNSTGHMEMDRPISFSTTTHAANTRTNLGFNSSLNAFWTASNTTAAVAALGIGSSGTSTVTRQSLGFNATLDSLWTATNAEAARNALEISNIATNVTRASLGFSTNLDNLWTATSQLSARSGIGFSTNLDSLWTATNQSNGRSALGFSTNLESFWTSTSVDQLRTNIVLGTNDEVQFRNLTVLGTGSPTNLGIRMGGTNYGLWGSAGPPSVGIAINGTNRLIVYETQLVAGAPIYWTNTTHVDTTRTNLKLGASWLTNTDSNSFREAIGFSTNLTNFWTATSSSAALNSLFITNNLTTINSGKTRFSSSMTDNDVIEMSHQSSGALMDIVLGSENLVDGTYSVNPKGSIGSGNGIFGVKYGTNDSDWGYPILLAPNSTDSIIAANGTTGSQEIKTRLGFSTNLNSFWSATNAVSARDALGITTTGSTNTRETLGFSTNLDTFWTATNFSDARSALGIDTNNLTTRESLGLATNSSVQFSDLHLSQSPSSGLYTLSLGSRNTGFRGAGGGTNDWLFTINGTEYLGLYQGSLTLGNAGIQTRVMSPMTFFYGTISGGSTNTGYIAFGGTAPAVGAAISRTNLGLGASWLTNTTALGFRTGIGFNSNLNSFWTASNATNARLAIDTLENKTDYVFLPDEINAPYVNENSPFIKVLTPQDLPKRLILTSDSSAHEYVEIQLPSTESLVNNISNLDISDFVLSIQTLPQSGDVDAIISFRVRNDTGTLLTGWITGYGEDNYNPIYRFAWDGINGWRYYSVQTTGYNLLYAQTPLAARQAIGLNLAALTNLTVSNFVRDIGLGVTNRPTFKGLTLSNTNDYTAILNLIGPFGTAFNIMMTDETLENGSYPAPRGSIGVDWQATNNFKVKYGEDNSDWGSVLYLDKDGDGGIARNAIGLSAPWLTNTNQLQFADEANIVPLDTYLSSSIGGGAGPTPPFPATNVVSAQRRIRYTINTYPGWIGTNTSGGNVYQNSNNNTTVILPRSLDGSKRGDIFILTSQFTGAGTNFVSRYGYTYSTNYQTNLVTIEAIANTKSNIGFINYDGFNWRRLRASDLGLPDVVEWVTPPAATNSTGTAGQAAYSDNYLYICISNNTWRRATLATW